MKLFWLVRLIVLVAREVRPAIVASSFETVDLVVGFVTMLRDVEITTGTHCNALRVTVTVCEDVALDTIDHRVVTGDGAILVHS